ncbi:MAG: hypothetical protein NTZ44_01160 [Candidatus Nomurabacteria bacterium]|nr:hypothetical protein [Candidatus Nomurabacteria bacterium]
MIQINKEKISKYLPSKKIAIIGIICIVVLTILYFFFHASQKAKYLSENEKNSLLLNIGNSTINDLVAKDSDGDGIQDWQENLWGTDKNNTNTFNGISDADYIAKKKEGLNTAEDTAGVNLTETEKFSREFFSAFTAMKTTEGVDVNLVNNFAESLGQNLVNPSIIDKYTDKDIKKDDSGDQAQREEYYLLVAETYDKYQAKGMGKELEILGDSLATYSATGTPDSVDELESFATAYQDFASELMTLSVPADLATYHLKIVNSANNTGISVSHMAKIINDPIVAVSGLAEYQKYEEAFTLAANALETTLPKDATISIGI